MQAQLHSRCSSVASCSYSPAGNACRSRLRLPQQQQQQQRHRRVRAAAPDATTDVPEDAFAELVRMAVEKDPSLATLAEQQLQKQREQQAAAAAREKQSLASSMLGPSLATLPNSSKPPWLRQRAPQGEKYSELFQQMRGLKLATVCEEAQCPNIGECWNGDLGEQPRFHGSWVPQQSSAMGSAGSTACNISRTQPGPVSRCALHNSHVFSR